MTAVSPSNLQFEVAADSTAAPIFGGIAGGVGIGPPPGMSWQYLGELPDNPNSPVDFIIVSPSSGTTSSVTLIGVNPSVYAYLRPGTYGNLAKFGQPGLPLSAAPGVDVQLTIDPPPPPAVSSVVSAASLEPQICPGELISIFGAHIGTPPISGQYNDAGLYPTTLGNTTVTIGGTPAPLLYVSQTQINAVVPFEVSGQKSADIIVTHDDVAAPTISVPILDTAPAIFTATGTGRGQGAIQNTTSVSSTANDAGNPAPPGSLVAIYTTGGGLLSITANHGTSLDAGGVILESGYAEPQAPVSLTIGGQPAQIQYAGVAPYEVAGMLQINAVIPPGIGSGPQLVVLKIGANDNSAQQVTVAVK